jgi:hypothetical protein
MGVVELTVSTTGLVERLGLSMHLQTKGFEAAMGWVEFAEQRDTKVASAVLKTTKVHLSTVAVSIEVEASDTVAKAASITEQEAANTITIVATSIEVEASDIDLAVSTVLVAFPGAKAFNRIVAGVGTVEVAFGRIAAVASQGKLTA